MMKKKINSILNSYKKISKIFLPAALTTTMLYYAYRFEIYRLIKSIYLNLNTINFFEYLKLSLHYDSSIILLSLLILLMIIIVTSNTDKIKYIIKYLFFITLLILLLTGIEFFRVYETTFQPGFIGSENSSYWLDMTAAYTAELSKEFYIKFLIIGMFILPATLFLTYKKYKFETVTSNNVNRISYYSSPGIILLFLIFSVFTNSKESCIKLARKFPSFPEKKIVRTLNELSMNPVYNIIFKTDFQKQGLKINNDIENNEPFSFKLNTDSISSSKIYQRLNLIPRGKKYNIIFYFFESTHSKYLDLKINGEYITKTWQRLSKNSLNLKKHYANFPLSANALFSVFTSAYDPVFTSPFDLNLVIQKNPNIKLKTIPEILNERGYRNCLIHTWDLIYVGQRKFLETRKFDKIIEDKHLKKTPPFNRRVGLGVDDRSMIEPAVKFIKAGRGKPFFITFVPMNPHSPYNIPDKKFMITGNIPESTPYRKKRWLNYVNSLHYSDYVLGKLVDRLEQENMLENTLIFLFADHGQAFYQHRQNYLHRHFIYEENVHVPFMIYNKKIFKKPVVHDGITRHIDILPTLLDILGIKQDEEQEGISFLSAHREQLALLHTYWDEDFNGIRDVKWKYIIRMKDNFEELYDLDNDPEEKNNLAEIEKDVLLKYRNFIKKSQNYKINYYKKFRM